MAFRPRPYGPGDQAYEVGATNKNKYLNGQLAQGIFYLNGNLIKKFDNNVELAKFLDIYKVTVQPEASKYLNNNLIYKNNYRFKPI